MTTPKKESAMATDVPASSSAEPSATATAPAAPAASTKTTRACIKNLPPAYSESKLKAHLQNASKSPIQITDCRILKTKDGRSRKIAFVGFATPSMAEGVVEYFDRTFIGTSRLSASLAFSKKKASSGDGGDGEGYRPWSKHSEGSSKYEQMRQKEREREEKLKVASGHDKGSKLNANTRGSKVNSNANAEMNETQRKKEEFLSAMGISGGTVGNKSGKDSTKVSKSKFWANDDAATQPTGIIEQPLNTANQADKTSEDGSVSSSDESNSDSDNEDEGTTNKKGTERGTVSSDLDFLRSKQVQADILTDESGDDSGNSSSDSDDDSSSSSSSGSGGSDDEDEGNASSNKDNQGTEKSTGIVELTAPQHHTTNSNTTTLHDRLFVRNLPFTATEEDLHSTFSQFGEIAAVHIPVDDSKRNKGYAFVTYHHRNDAKVAMETMDGDDFMGRLIHILPARPSADQPEDIDPNLSYKERQELLRQKEAEKSSKGWSSSLIRGDAVVDNISDRLGVSKGDVLNVKDGISSGNAAVRLALGETHIISENVSFFEEHGVDVTALESHSNNKKSGGPHGPAAPKRSKTLILVKNLPYDTKMEELTKMFHAIGGDVPTNILLPPSKTAALVEYGHASDARRAFRRLAYKKFKHIPLYLEWAPMANGVTGTATETSATTATGEGPEQKTSTNELVVEKGPVIDEEDPSTEATPGTVAGEISQTIYVKNLNFATTEMELKKAFATAGFQPRAVKIPTKAAPIKKRKGSADDSTASNAETRQVSMGFGFVEFPSEEEAMKSMKRMQGKVLDGHAMEIKLSSKSLSPPNQSAATDTSSKSSKNTKIMVRNVPFEATRTELLQLFGSFGQLKKVRLPKKFDGTHRGFAFCEYVSAKEAHTAMTSLSRTHLYGRHLVLEWAAKGDDGTDGGNVDLGKVREKAKRDALSAGLGGAGRAKGKKGRHLKF